VIERSVEHRDLWRVNAKQCVACVYQFQRGEIVKRREWRQLRKQRFDITVDQVRAGKIGTAMYNTMDNRLDRSQFVFVDKAAEQFVRRLVTRIESRSGDLSRTTLIADKGRKPKR